MTKKFLFGRKRTGELGDGGGAVVMEDKKESLLSLKLQALSDDAQNRGVLNMLALDALAPDANQPRKVFKSIDQLAKSIEENGIIQPLVVQEQSAGKYTIIVGERRYWAAKQLKLEAVPCIVRSDLGQDQAKLLVLQLLENDQREAVSPLEEAEALAVLAKDYTQGQMAKELGRDAGWISIRLGLLQASERIQNLVKEGLIEDVRTLHELRKFETDHPKKAQDLLAAIEKNEVSGSYRTVIANLRKKSAKGKSEPISPAITKIEKQGDKLLLHVAKKKRPVSYTIDQKTLVQFLAQVSYE